MPGDRREGARDNLAMGKAQHWERIFAERDPNELSWYEEVPEASLALIEEAAIPFGAAILDVGGGTSRLAGLLLASGYTDVTVTDISPAALALARADLGVAAEQITWVQSDVRSHDFARLFDLWHDRAVFHFMVEDDDRDRYLSVLRRTLRPGGHLVLAAFGPGGPSHCSGLPVVRYGAEDLVEILGADFELVSAQIQTHQTPAGQEQEFSYSHFRRRLGV
jgi:SAM-dependent methyltransferase